MFGMWDAGAGMGWWMIFGGFWMVIFWGGIIALIVWGIKKITQQGGSTPEKKPLDLARERYAKGEISREEFDQIKKDLY